MLLAALDIWGKLRRGTGALRLAPRVAFPWSGPAEKLGFRVNERGVAYLALLILIASMGAALAMAGTLWHQAQLRTKEEELLFAGRQYRKAIRSYYESSPGDKGYPPTLESLLQDERMLTMRRHLRRPYRDPLTNSAAWGLVKAPGGGIMGVYSLAPGRPVKIANFPAELGWSGGKSSYGDWQFVYLPASGKLGFGQR